MLQDLPGLVLGSWHTILLQDWSWVQDIEIILQDLPGLVLGLEHRDTITRFTKSFPGFKI